MSDRNSSRQPVQLTPGDHVGAYRIERELGSGGMADVFYAVHEGLRRPAAIKVLSPSLATEEVHLQRFMQEARAAASLVHPNIVQVYDVGQDGEHRYIAQEYIPGSNLRQYVTAGKPASQNCDAESPPSDRPLELSETLSILLQILAALNKSATSGIVHRDIKPENIMLTTEGEVKVADFGLARVLLGDDPQLTRAGTTLGTPMYMSPEQIQEGAVDIRSDLYSLGVTLYHMLTGRPPFTGETPLALAMKHVQAEVPDIRQLREGLPDSIVELVSRLLEKNPDNRFATPSEVLGFLKQRRHDDLSAVWPEQVVPLPGASTLNTAGPMRATMQLQSKLRNGTRRFRDKLLTRLTATGVLVASFIVGATFTLERPLQLFTERPTDIYKDIPKQETVVDQYQSALLSTNMNRRAKWEAVEYYFPEEAEYVGRARLQLASTLQQMGDYEDAVRTLNRNIFDDRIGDFYKARAYLQIAVGADENGDDEKVKENVNAAISIASDSKFSTADRLLLNKLVRSMSPKISKRWLAELPN